MAQLKDKDGINFNPNTTAELVAYDTTTNVKEKIEQIEQVSGGVAKPNLFDADDIQNGKGVIYYQAGAILSNSHYSCVFIPLAFDTYYCFAGYDWVSKGGTDGANNIALAKGDKTTFSNLTTSDFVDGAEWLATDAAFVHDTNIYKQSAPNAFVFKTPKASDMTDGTLTIGFVINITFYAQDPVRDTLKVCEGLYPVEYSGSIKGKNVAFFGDSITQGTDGGFVDKVATKASLNIADNFGSSGSATNRLADIMLGEAFRGSTTYPPKDYNKYQAVVIQIGTNGGVSGDINADIPDIGVYDITSYPYNYSASGKTITSATLTEPKDFFTECFANTFYGNIALCIEYVRYINPNCRIFLTTIPPSERGNHDAVRTALINLADKMSVQVIDAQAHAGLGLWNITQWTYDTSGQRTHLNAKGNEMWGSYVAHDLQNEWYLTELD